MITASISEKISGKYIKVEFLFLNNRVNKNILEIRKKNYPLLIPITPYSALFTL